jgi:hypothetical protein
VTYSWLLTLTRVFATLTLLLLPSSYIKRNIDDQVMRDAKGQSRGRTGMDLVDEQKRIESALTMRRMPHQPSQKVEAGGQSRASLKRQQKKAKKQGQPAPQADEEEAKPASDLFGDEAQENDTKKKTKKKKKKKSDEAGSMLLLKPKKQRVE